MNKLNSIIIATLLLSFGACISTKPNEDKYLYDVIVIGSGPAGLTTGIYASRANLQTLVIEGDMPGGLLTETPFVENWSGHKSISGFDLMENIREHAQHAGATLLFDTVSGVDFGKQPYKIMTQSGKTYAAQSIVIATGARRKSLGCSGEKEYWMKGISACATCDAPFYKWKTVVVVGGGRTALTEAYHLAKFAKEVIVVHTSDTFTVKDPIKDRLFKEKNVRAIHSSYVKEIGGDGKHVTHVILQDKKTKKEIMIKTYGVFVSIGFEPNTKLFEGQITLNKQGYISVVDGVKTSKDGVFTAGDVSHQQDQQAIVAAGEGAKAGLACIRYLDTQIQA